jgi:prevent-host-death family protein
LSEVGIRELKAKASKIIDEVREHAARYTITRRGRPVAVLLPIADAPATASAGGPPLDDVWRELDRLGEEIGRGWRAPESSDELLAGMRR